MKKREIWAIIKVEDVVKHTDVNKVMKCYDLKMWEKQEILALKNSTYKSLNEFRWEYISGTLELTNDCFSDVGYLVKDLIEDIKMGYHKVSDDIINLDVEEMDKLNNYFDKIEIANFEYEPLRDYHTNKITHIEIYYDRDDISNDVKCNEINELIEFLELDNIYKINKVAC